MSHAQTGSHTLNGMLAYRAVYGFPDAYGDSRARRNAQHSGASAWRSPRYHRKGACTLSGDWTFTFIRRQPCTRKCTAFSSVCMAEPPGINEISKLSDTPCTDNDKVSRPPQPLGIFRSAHRSGCRSHHRCTWKPHPAALVRPPSEPGNHDTDIE